MIVSPEFSPTVNEANMSCGLHQFDLRPFATTTQWMQSNPAFQKIFVSDMKKEIDENPTSTSSSTVPLELFNGFPTPPSNADYKDLRSFQNAEALRDMPSSSIYNENSKTYNHSLTNSSTKMLIKNNEESVRNSYYSSDYSKVKKLNFDNSNLKQHHTEVNNEFNQLSPNSVESNDYDKISQKMDQEGSNINSAPSSPSQGDQSLDEMDDDSTVKIPTALQKTPIISDEKLECPLCDFYCNIRSQFNDHLLTHEAKCHLCEFEGDSKDLLREHLKTIHDQIYSEEEFWLEDDNGKNTIQKSKLTKCKYCDFTATTKIENWKHRNQHIKEDKALKCPKCPFVTEHKQHMHYHLLNHFKSKPFKCDKCTYSCVNKSMLNSHLKSHSNVFQFRCTDCNYATKYMHSLKLHLRKYEHNPATVLNSDGTPNPMKVVDIYGTKRGPKRKRKLENKALPSVTSLFNQSNRLSYLNNNNNNNNSNGILFGFSLPQFSHLENSSMKWSEKNNNNPSQSMNDEEMAEIKSPLDLTCATDNQNGHNNIQQVVKNRRKGKAFKLEKVNDDIPYNEPEDLSKFPQISDAVSTTTNVNIIQTPPQEDKEVDNKSRVEEKQEFACNYCDIIFKDIVMHQVHMGYHGFQDPFTCNMCGTKTSDKISFFLHIARVSHS